MITLPASSIDTFLACSIMIILVLTALVGVAQFMEPYMSSLSNRDVSERYQQLSSSLLLLPGNPSGWGQSVASPTGLGLARTGSALPYELDVDKVSRLNSLNSYSLSYSELWKALGVKDVSFQIAVKPIFDVSIDLTSTSPSGNGTIYEFKVVTAESGMPVVTDLSAYFATGNFVSRVYSPTSSNGTATLDFNISNSLVGSALMIVFAQSIATPQIVSFNVYTFSVNSSTPLPNRTFTLLSPLNYVLNASLVSPSVNILAARIFTFSHNSSLTVKAQTGLSMEYFIPTMLDSSPMVMVLTGNSGATSFAEWVAYPQLPLLVGADFNQSTAGTKIISVSSFITINNALYEVVTTWGGTN